MTVPADPASALALPRDLPYRIRWRSHALRLGSHKGTASGSGGLFRDLTSLTEQPDPRRIDLRSSLRDPFGQLYVRRFEQKTAISVYALVDVSASMSFVGNMRKMDAAAALCAALAASARRIGDKFGLMGCDTRVLPELSFPAGRSRSGEIRLSNALRSFPPAGRGAMGLVDAAQQISGKRKLVFLISDFHMPESVLVRIFEALASHDVRPLHLVDTRETAGLPDWGILPLTDLETGQGRLVFLRPSLKAAWQRQSAGRAARLDAIAAGFGAKPFQIADRIDWDQLSAHLMEPGA